jgi:hypothetical protein
MTTGPEPQTASAVLMVRPLHFGWNEQTAASNTFQHPPREPPLQVRQQALAEFAALHALLERSGVRVMVFEDLPTPHTPDALFPNNWLTSHSDGTLVLYPMAAPNRRAERRPQLIAALRRELGVRRVVDLTAWESQGRFLEGTGSLVLDRVHRVAYAAASARTDPAVVAVWAAALDYRPILFSTLPQRDQPIYHTNVVLALGTTTAVVCLEAITPGAPRAAVAAALAASGRQLLAITGEQLRCFAGNLLELRSQDGQRLWVMSTQAFAALEPAQRQQLASEATLLHTPLPTIEAVGGGSARCLLAELFAATPPGQ